MNRDVAISEIDRLRAELHRLGVYKLIVFGSTGRGVSTAASDVDVCIGLDATYRGLDRIEQLDRIERLLTAALGTSVDVVEEPVRSEGLRSAIERDGVRVV